MVKPLLGVMNNLTRPAASRGESIKKEPSASDGSVSLPKTPFASADAVSVGSGRERRPRSCGDRRFRRTLVNRPRSRRQLQNGGALAFAQPGHQHHLAAGKLQRVMVHVGLVGIDLA